ncbi:hypothetical protein [Moorena sp. SIO2C4]|nr:hypothetical protein [Moorena sp. SIO2C4]
MNIGSNWSIAFLVWVEHMDKAWILIRKHMRYAHATGKAVS